MLPHLFKLWDAAARVVMGIRPAGPDSVLGVAVRRYHGPQLRAADGAGLAAGDLVAEIHLDSRHLATVLAGATDAHARILLMRQAMIAGLRQLSGRIQTEPDLAGVRGIYGITLLHRGVRALGFDAADLPAGPGSRLMGAYLRLLLAFYHPEGRQRLARRSGALVPRVIFMPRSVLLARYREEAPEAVCR